MRTVGMATTMVATAAVLGAMFVGIRSIPDIKRYLKIRQM